MKIRMSSLWRTDSMIVILLASGLYAWPAEAQIATRTYWIDETLDFTGNGCGNNADLNNVTSQLQTRLNNNSWSGIRWADANAWPQDFQDSSVASGGLESSAADSQLLSIHAGHGNVGLLGWGFPHNGVCTTSTAPQTRLGTLTGNQSSYAMYLDSCVMRLDQLSQVFPNQVTQQFGYNNSPSIGDDQPANFFDDTATVKNDQAWVERMDDRPGIFAGFNSPVALTFATSSTQCAAFQANAKLKGGVLLTTAPEPWSFWCVLFRDNGRGPC